MPGISLLSGGIKGKGLGLNSKEGICMHQSHKLPCKQLLVVAHPLTVVVAWFLKYGWLTVMMTAKKSHGPVSEDMAFCCAAWTSNIQSVNGLWGAQHTCTLRTTTKSQAELYISWPWCKPLLVKSDCSSVENSA